MLTSSYSRWEGARPETISQKTHAGGVDAPGEGIEEENRGGGLKGYLAVEGPGWGEPH